MKAVGLEGSRMVRLTKRDAIALKLLLVLILICDANLFSLSVLPEKLLSLANSQSRVLETVFVLLYLGFVVHILAARGYYVLIKGFDAIVGLFIGATFLIYVTCSIIYEYPIHDIGSGYSVLLLLAYIPLSICYVFFDQKKFIIKSIIVVGIVYCLVALLDYYFRSNGMPEIMNSDYLLSGYRNGRFRNTNVSNYLSMSLLVTLIAWFHSKRRILIPISVLQLFVIVYVSQTRSFPLFVAAALLVGLVFRLNGMRLLAIVGALMAGAVLQWQKVVAFVSSFSPDGALAISTTARLEALTYYLSNVFRHYLFGIGFIDKTNTYQQEQILAGGMRIYVSDIGIYGAFGVFGVVAVFFFVAILGYFRFTIRSIPKASRGTDGFGCIVFFSFFLICNLTSVSFLSGPFLLCFSAVIVLCKEVRYLFSSEELFDSELDKRLSRMYRF